MTREEYFEIERAEKRVIMFLVELGLNPLHNNLLDKKALRLVHDFMSTLTMWGYVERFDMDADIERSRVYMYYRIKKGLVDSKAQLKKRLRQIDWNSADGKVLSRYANKAIEII